MKRLLTVSWVLLATVLFLSALLWAEPFERANQVLDRAFGGAPKWTQVESLVVDPQTQETTHGDRPMPGLEALASCWGSHRDAKRVVFLGNSQMQAMSLAPGEPAAVGYERTYFDQVSDYYKKQGSNVLLYRLSAPGLSYAESLWYVEYLLQHPTLRPDAIVLQLNYQAFWNGGIRDGMWEMLKVPAFETRIKEISQSSQPFAEYFNQALNGYSAQLAKTTPSGKMDESIGSAFETRVRIPLDKLGLKTASESEKDSIEQMLYRFRLYFLRLKPSTARSISGPRLVRSQSAVEALAERCRDEGVKLVLFTAPLNPLVSLYRSAEDKATYENFVQAVARSYNLSLFQFDDLVAAGYWGRLLNSPDPLHLGRRGHQIVAAKMIEVVQKTVPRE